MQIITSVNAAVTGGSETGTVGQFTIKRKNLFKKLCLYDSHVWSGVQWYRSLGMFGPLRVEEQIVEFTPNLFFQG